MSRVEKLLQYLEEQMRKHDWYYAMSDDHRVWSAGEKAAQEITNTVHQLESEGKEEEVTTLFSKYCPWHRPKKLVD